MFILPLINPIRFQNTRLNYEFDHNSNFCYFQKWQLGDVINLQFLSTSQLTLKMQDVTTGVIVKTFLSNEIPTLITDENTKVNEFNIKLDSSIPFSKYIFILSTPSMSSVFFSTIFDYSEIHEGTILLTYKNTYNAFNLIFETAIEFTFRVEGTVNLFKPKLDSVTYVDQKKDSVMLSAQPYRIFSLIVGTGRGVPDWCLDIINRILATDTKAVDNLNFEITEGSELEVQRIENYSMSAATIEITEVSNPYVQEFRDIYVLSDNDGNLITTNNNNLNLIF